MRLRSHLVLLVLAALVPVLGFAVLVIRENADLQRDAIERGMRATAHAVAATVDQTIETTITTLEALAESDHLEAPNLRAFHALADPTRRAIFERLRHGPLTVGRLARGLPVSRPAVSQHLRVLEEAGLVVPRAEGTRRFYRIETKGLEELRRYLERFWDDVLDAFRNEAERGATSPRPTERGAAAPRRTRRRPHVER